MSDIKQAAYASIGGKVARVFSTRNGAAIEVHVQEEGSRYPDRYTVWGLGDEVAEGDMVEVRGWLKTMPETFQKRDGSEGHGVKRTINDPRLTKHEPAQAAQSEAWGGGGSYGDDAPF